MSTNPDLEETTTINLEHINKYALVVGVNKSIYSDFRHPLDGAERDAEKMASALIKEACNFKLVGPGLPGERNDDALIGARADTMRLRQAISQLIQQRTPQDFLLFYYSGHAQPMEVNGHKDIYLVTHNFREEDVTGNPITHISLRELRDLLYKQTDAGIVVIVLDCCYGGCIIFDTGNSYKVGVDIRKLIDEYFDKPIQRAGYLRAIITAAGSNTTAAEKNGQGVMTRNLLSALSGDIEEVLDNAGQINIHLIYSYLQNQMGKEQFPNYEVKSGRQCVFAHFPERTKSIRDRARVQAIRVQHQEEVIRDIRKYLAAIPYTQQFDSSLCLQASFADLDREQVSKFLQQKRTQQYERFNPTLSNEEQLEFFNFAQGDTITYGALLCFGKTPSKWITGATSRCIEWSGRERGNLLTDVRDYRGSLLDQFELTRNFLRKCLRLGKVIDSKGSIEEWEIPDQVLAEALANALVHREYVYKNDAEYEYRNDDVRIEVFDDRIEISNPGDHPLHLPPEKMVNNFYPRNPQIASIFYLYGYIEHLGKGIERMQELMEKAGLPPPKFELSATKRLTVTLYRPEQGTAKYLGSFTINSVQVGQTLANYRLIRALETQEDSEIFLGEHILLKKPATIKVLKGLNTEELDVFLTRVQSIINLVHPNIVRILDFGIEGKIPFLVIDYTPTRTLREAYSRDKKPFRLPSLETVITYTKQIADALQYLHNNKYVYGKIRPESLLLGSKNEVLLADLSTSTDVAPTEEEIDNYVYYMSPEQLQGTAVPASDQYALAALIYEWVCGEYAFDGTPSEILSQKLKGTLISPSYRAAYIQFDVYQVIMAALREDPRQRFPSIQAFATALEQEYRRSYPTKSSQIETTSSSEASASSSKSVQHQTTRRKNFYSVSRLLEVERQYLATEKNRFYRYLGLIFNALATVFLVLWSLYVGKSFLGLLAFFILPIFLLHVVIVDRRLAAILAALLAGYWGLVGWVLSTLINSFLPPFFPTPGVLSVLFFLISFIIQFSYVRNKSLK